MHIQLWYTCTSMPLYICGDQKTEPVFSFNVRFRVQDKISILGSR